MIVLINIERLISRLLPPSLNKSKQITWLALLLEPLKLLNLDLLSFRAKVRKELKQNGQTIILENLLNEQISSSNNQIVVINQSFQPSKVYSRYRSELQQPTYTFFRSELQQPTYTFFRNVSIGYDFIVQIPASALMDLERIKAILNKYKLATKRYKITVI